MPFSFHCDSCDKKFTVSSQLIGKKIRCKGCQNVMRIPDPSDYVAIQTEWIVDCDDCGRQHRPDESLIGKRIRCKCGAILHLQENTDAQLNLAPVDPLPDSAPPVPGTPAPPSPPASEYAAWQVPPPQISGDGGAQREADAERRLKQRRIREQQEKDYFES